MIMSMAQRERVQPKRNQILRENTSNRNGQNIRKKSSSGNNRNKGNDRNRENNRNKKIAKGFLNFVFYSFVLGVLIVLFLMYGPSNKFRNWYITTAMTTMNHKYLATWFYSSETIADVLANNKMIEVEGITDTSQINSDTTQKPIEYENEYDKAILERDPNHPDYKIIEVSGKGYEGYLAVVYDASKIHTLVTSKLNVSGQYITKMAENEGAKLAINGGFFVDLKEDRTGGRPMGITMCRGKVVTSDKYNGEGGVVGFDNNNKLVLGKMDITKAKELQIRDAVTAGPFLIMNGKASTVVGNGGWGTAPRTAIGQRKDGVVLMLIIDGRKVGRAGASMDELIKIMQRYGAYNAAALDGGTSSVLVENYKILNDPIDSDGVHKTRPVATGFGVFFDEK